MKRRPIQITVFSLAVLAAAALACDTVGLGAPTPTQTQTNTPAPTATFTPVPSPTLPPEPTLTPTVPPLPPDPQRIEFEAEDGTKLVGYYFPAAVNPAPMVVLMHWAGGDQRDWTQVEMVPWLTNRGAPPKLAARAVQSNFWPPMPDGVTFGVFTFDYRGFGESGGPKNEFRFTGWLMDSKAAMETARTLPGVDPTRMAAIGASIGADGAVDGCIVEGCLGALSLSPGSYLNVPYKEAVTALDKEGKPVWCLASEGDGESAPTCKSASGDRYQMFMYPGRAHGMMLLKPGFDPDVGQTILDFLLLVFNLAA